MSPGRQGGSAEGEKGRRVGPGQASERPWLKFLLCQQVPLRLNSPIPKTVLKRKFRRSVP